MKADPATSIDTSTARQSASAPDGEKVRIGTDASVSSRRPKGSSTLVRPRAVRSGVNSDAFAAKYSSTSAWKSRWSRPRLRNAATSKTTPATRPMTSAWLETSMAQACTCCSTITANRACRSGASGVVSEVGTSRPAMRVPTVPTTAAPMPATLRPPSRSRVVVVLPWVPVTAIRIRERAGSA